MGDFSVYMAMNLKNALFHDINCVYFLNCFIRHLANLRFITEL